MRYSCCEAKDKERQVLLLWHTMKMMSVVKENERKKKNDARENEINENESVNKNSVGGVKKS